MVCHELAEEENANRKGRCIIMLANAVVKIRRLGKVLQKDVRNGKLGIFRNTIIVDHGEGIGYDRDGNRYVIDAEDIPFVARYVWHVDKNEYLVTEQLSHRNGRPVRMEELILGLVKDCHSPC